MFVRSETTMVFTNLSQNYGNPPNYNPQVLFNGNSFSPIRAGSRLIAFVIGS